MNWLSLLLGLPSAITNITKSIADYRIAATAAATDQERIHAEERVKELEARRDVMISARPWGMDSIIRALYGAPPAIYFAKLWLWDKVLGWGSTDPISDDMRTIATVVVGFYFLHSAFSLLGGKR